MAKLVADGLITGEGKTRARHYKLKVLAHEVFGIERDGFWTEDTIWRERILPLMKNVKQNIIDLYQYGFTEMLNNVLKQSEYLRGSMIFQRCY
jgi:hypothetical protein